MSTSRMADLAGQVLGGRYRLIAPVGTGASAQVYVADDLRLHRRVAVKVLHPSLADDLAFTRRFETEAQLVAQLTHPNIVAVYDWGDDLGPYLVTEFLSGGSLRDLLDAGNRLSVSQALVVGLEAARGLEAAHERGLAHRDVKPDNLLFDQDGHVRVADFGVARAVAEAGFTDIEGTVMATARYASPEQARGQSAGPEGDVYSLALVLVEAVTGTVPFASDTALGTLMARLDGPLVVPPELGSLREPLQRAGRLDPGERPDATELAVLLLAAAADLHEPEPLPLVPIVVPTVGGLTDPTLVAAARAAEEAGELPPLGSTAILDLRDEPGELGAADTVLEGRASRRAAAEPQPPPTPPTEGRARSPRRWPAVVLAVILGALVAGAAVYAVLDSQLASHPVPDLIGFQEDELDGIVGDFGWEITRLEGRQDGSAPGEIIAQDPEPGTELREGDALTITVSLGATLGTPPVDLVGLPRDEAERRIVDAGYVVGTVTETFDEDVEAGTVLSVMELPLELPRGTPIDFEVSAGPAPRDLPDLAGQSFGEAEDVLEQLGLEVQRVDEPSTEVAEGSVIETDPGPGAQVDRGSTITVVVSSGPPWINLPDVVGESVDDATEILEDAGLRVSGVEGPPNQDVTGTRPTPGEPVRVGGEIVLITNGPQGDEDSTDDSQGDDGDGGGTDDGGTTTTAGGG